MGTVLLAALWMNARPGAHGQVLFTRGELARILPGVELCKVARDLPLGATEYDREKVDRILDYDDVVNRVYTTNQGEFQVYIGYWAAGKLSPTHIAAHVPDRCWIYAGMTPRVIDDNYQLRAGTSSCPPGHWRIFVKQATPEIHVVFWHKVGAEDYNYSSIESKVSIYRRLKGVILDLFVAQPDQLFVRISSNVPLDAFAKDPVFQAAIIGIELIERRVRSGVSARNSAPAHPRVHS